MTITGIGAVTGYGWGTTSLWDGLLSGKPAAKLIDGFGPTGADSAWLAREIVNTCGSGCSRRPPFRCDDRRLRAVLVG
jgi:hypothetical protein